MTELMSLCQKVSNCIWEMQRVILDGALSHNIRSLTSMICCLRIISSERFPFVLTSCEARQQNESVVELTS